MPAKRDLPATPDAATGVPAVPCGNLLQGIPAALPEELVEVLLQQPGLRLERILSRGHCSPANFWYDQPAQEWVLLLQGEAELQFAADNRRRRLRAGDYLLLPAGCRHRVAWTSSAPEAIWLALFFPPG